MPTQLEGKRADSMMEPGNKKYGAGSEEEIVDNDGLEHSKRRHANLYDAVAGEYFFPL